MLLILLLYLVSVWAENQFEFKLNNVRKFSTADLKNVHDGSFENCAYNFMRLFPFASLWRKSVYLWPKTEQHVNMFRRLWYVFSLDIFYSGNTFIFRDFTRSIIYAYSIFFFKTHALSIPLFVCMALLTCIHVNCFKSDPNYVLVRFICYGKVLTNHGSQNFW